ncbi:amino acid transporter AVT1I-like protein [Tanacetum coccineum]
MVGNCYPSGFCQKHRQRTCVGNSVGKFYVGNMSETPKKNEGMTFLRACFNTANTPCGVWILSVPYALPKGGWVGLLLLLTVAGVCFYTQILLDKCMARSRDKFVSRYSGSNRDNDRDDFSFSRHVDAKIYLADMPCP